MVELTAHEARVLGVLVEKAQTTPDLYPLTLNALTNGANQKNNRNPVMELSEDEVLTAVIGLRNKGLLVQVDTPGARVSKYKHNAPEKLQVNMRELAILAELLLRGPQTIGELRGRAARMHALETIEMAQSTVNQLMSREEPLVKKIAPAPGDRAERYVQLMCPDAHPVDAVAPAAEGNGGATEVSAAPTLSQRVVELEEKIQRLEAAIKKLCEQLGVEGLV